MPSWCIAQAATHGASHRARSTSRARAGSARSPAYQETRHVSYAAQRLQVKLRSAAREAGRPGGAPCCCHPHDDVRRPDWSRPKAAANLRQLQRFVGRRRRGSRHAISHCSHARHERRWALRNNTGAANCRDADTHPSDLQYTPEFEGTAESDVAQSTSGLISALAPSAGSP